MEIFINELSLESQYHSDAEFRAALLVFIGVFDLLREKIREKEFYKDSLFIYSRAIKNEYFVASYNRMNKDVREAFRKIIFNKSNPKDWRGDQKHSPTIDYLCPALDFEKVNDTSVAEAAERQLLQPEIKKLLINFSGSRFGKLPGPTVQVLKRCEPEQSTDVSFIEKKEELKNILEETQLPVDIFLHDPDRFRRTRRKIQGRVVFEEIETRHLWYLDNFHKNHYEVFDRDRKHLGEADLFGRLLPGTRDPGKDNSIEK